MNVNGMQKNITQFSSGLGIRRRLLKIIPNIDVQENPELTDWAHIINRPDVNRGIMGLTAILTQPLIDRYNPNVDEETAKTSMYRTIGKIVAGTTVGCIVRSSVYYLLETFMDTRLNAPKWKRTLMPDVDIQASLNTSRKGWFKGYKNIISTGVGLTVMLFTNPLLDVPMTSFITEKLMKLKKTQSTKEGQVK